MRSLSFYDSAWQEILHTSVEEDDHSIRSNAPRLQAMGLFLDKDNNLQDIENIDGDGMDEEPGGATTPRDSQAPSPQEVAADRRRKRSQRRSLSPSPKTKAKKKAKERKGMGPKPKPAASGPTKRAAEHDLENDAQQKHDNEEADIEDVKVPAADILDV